MQRGEILPGKCENAFLRLSFIDPRIEESLASFLWLRDFIIQKNLNTDSIYYLAYGHLLLYFQKHPEYMDPLLYTQQIQKAKKDFDTIKLVSKELYTEEKSIEKLARTYKTLEKIPSQSAIGARDLRMI
jgi:hypothetical protein